MKTLTFVNPANGYEEKIESPALGTFLLGPFYIGLKGAWGPAIGYAVLAILTGGLFWLVLPFLAEGIFRKHFMALGWSERTQQVRSSEPMGEMGIVLGALGVMVLILAGFIAFIQLL